MMKYKLGKLPARPDAVQMKFKSFIHADKLPTPPLRIGHELIGHEWKILGNAKHSDCVFAGAAHEEMIFSHMGAAGPGADFTEISVLSDYAAATGWDGTDETDNGADMSSAARYRRRIGILDSEGKRHKVHAYLALTPGDPDDLAMAVWLTGAVGIGINTPKGAEKKFDLHQPWDETLLNDRTVGGHYIPVIGRNTRGLWLIVTWGKIQGMSQAFYEHFCDEALCYITPSIIRKTGLSPEGFALAEIKRQVEAL